MLKRLSFIASEVNSELDSELDSETSTINIEIIYALPEQQNIITTKLPQGSTVLEAITKSKILLQHPHLNLDSLKVGIFSHVCKLTEQLDDGDRIEIYRPLIIDPKEARRDRAINKKAK